MYSYCKSLCLDPGNEILLNRIITEKKCKAEDFLYEFSKNGFEIFALNFKSGLLKNDSFPEYNGEIYFYDVNGKTAKHLWGSFNNNNNQTFNYEPTIEQTVVREVITQDGFEQKQIKRVVINPIYIFAALKLFSVIDDNPKIENYSIKEFKDIIDVKYHSLIPEFYKLLGDHFPDYYDLNGKSKQPKRNTKAILSSWYACLLANNIITIYPNKNQKEAIAVILGNMCKLQDGITDKTLFEPKLQDHPDFKNELKKLDISLKKLIGGI